MGEINLASPVVTRRNGKQQVGWHFRQRVIPQNMMPASPTALNARIAAGYRASAHWRRNCMQHAYPIAVSSTLTNVQ